MAGRPAVVTQEKQEAICQWIAEGNSLVSWCKANDIHYSTVMRTLSDNEPFRDNYARARELQADYLAADIVDIADELCTTIRADKHKPGEEGEVEVVFDATAVARNRLRVDARKWYASKLAPKKYGEKLELAGDPDSPLTVEIVRFGGRE